MAGLALGVVRAPGAEDTLRVLNAFYQAFSTLFGWVLIPLALGLFCIVALYSAIESLQKHDPCAPGIPASFESPGRDFVSTLTQALDPLDRSRPLSLEIGAETANTSPRTLRRWLALEGTSWRGVRQRLQFEACKRLLLDSSLTLAEVADALGYSDQAHFTRGFRRWTGETPGAYRRRRILGSSTRH